MPQPPSITLNPEMPDLDAELTGKIQKTIEASYDAYYSYYQISLIYNAALAVLREEQGL